MILADYPGHFMAGAMLLAAAALMVVAFRTHIARSTGPWRFLLGAMQYAAVAALIVIIWNPSRRATSESNTRNSVLVVFDTSESMSVKDASEQDRLARALELFHSEFQPEDPDSPLYNVCGFDSDFYAGSSESALRRWGARTNMHSLMSTLNRYDLAAAAGGPDSSSRVVGAVVFTDGQADNKSVESYMPLKRDDFKVLFVGIGSDETPRDVAVSGIRAPARVAVETAYKVEVDLSTRGVEKERIVVALLEDDSVVDMKSYTPQGDSKTTLSFALGAMRLGRRRLSARARLVGDEPNVANNTRATIVEVVEAPRLRVLLYSQVASLDFGKVRSALARDEKIDFEVGLDAVISPDLAAPAASMSGHVPLPEDAAGFAAYDTIILGPCDASSLKRSQVDGLYDFVTKRGGGLVVLVGRDEFDLVSSGEETIEALMPLSASGRGANRAGRTAPLNFTTEAIAGGALSGIDLSTYSARAAAYRTDMDKKPAAAVFAEAFGAPVLIVHRVGRGRVAFLNFYGLYSWYREDLDGGLLREVLSSVVANVGRIPGQEAHLDLFASRSEDDPLSVLFEASAYDTTWEPLEGATVLLEVAGATFRMEETSGGAYQLAVANLTQESFVARALAEKGGNFVGEKVLATSLPLPRGEMDAIERDRAFLESLAKRVTADYVDAEGLSSADARRFEVFSSTVETGLESAWQRWLYLVLLVGLLSATWFARRTIGLI